MASPKEALARLAPALGLPAVGQLLAQVSAARETGALPAGAAGPAVFQIMALADALRMRAEKLG